MSPWTLCSAVLVACFVPCAIATFRGGLFDRLVGLEMTALLLSLTLVTLCEAFRRPGFLDLAVALSLLSFGGALVFVRSFERWL